jgi:predicted dehydrogenase
MTLQVVLIGCGRMGTIHAQNAYENPRINLKYIVERDTSKHSSLATKFPGVQFITDFSVALNDTEIQGVIVCTPTLLHPEHILQVKLLFHQENLLDFINDLVYLFL